MKKLLVCILFIFIGSQASSEDVYSGKIAEAYRAGEYAKALKICKPLVEQGDAKAQFWFGIMHDEGNGVLKDKTEAVKWYLLSAKQAYSHAQYNLGYMHKEGEGVLKDYMASHMWYNISSANGHPYAGEWRDKVADVMTPDAIEKATEMARECMASDYKKCGY